jgi:hypothetical protein
VEDAKRGSLAVRRRQSDRGLTFLWNEAYDAKAALAASRQPRGEKLGKLAKIGGFFEWLFRHFKMNLCDVEPCVEMIYEATAAPARAPFGGRSAISVHMHASEVERRRRLSALSRFTGNATTIGGLNTTGFWGREGMTGAISAASHRAHWPRIASYVANPATLPITIDRQMQIHRKTDCQSVALRVCPSVPVSPAPGRGTLGHWDNRGKRAEGDRSDRMLRLFRSSGPCPRRSRYARQVVPDQDIRLNSQAHRPEASPPGSFRFASHGRQSAERILWPGMLGIAGAEVLSHLVIGCRPETPQVVRDLDGPIVRPQ